MRGRRDVHPNDECGRRGQKRQTDAVLVSRHDDCTDKIANPSGDGAYLLLGRSIHSILRLVETRVHCSAIGLPRSMRMIVELACIPVRGRCTWIRVEREVAEGCRAGERRGDATVANCEIVESQTGQGSARATAVNNKSLAGDRRRMTLCRVKQILHVSEGLGQSSHSIGREENGCVESGEFENSLVLSLLKTLARFSEGLFGVRG